MSDSGGSGGGGNVGEKTEPSEEEGSSCNEVAAAAASEGNSENTVASKPEAAAASEAIAAAANDQDEDEDQSAVQEANLSRIRIAVNDNKIKLWVEPYYKEGRPDNGQLMRLADTLSATLEPLDTLSLLEGLRTLQRNALSKLEARDALQNSNQLQLKVKLSKGLLASSSAIDDDVTNCKHNDVTSKRSFNVAIDPEATGSDLAKEIASRLKDDVDPEGIRLISGGKTLSGGGGGGGGGNDGGSELRRRSLRAEGLKPGATVLAVQIDRHNQALAIVQEQRKLLNTAKSDTKLVANSNLELTDQTGKELDLPAAEKNSLIMAMSLHEKGKAAMRKSNFELALVFLLEASDEYQQCRNSQILNSVDNYALLNLDVAWCYLKVGNMSELPHAFERLSECESNLASSYGANMERVRALKGGVGSQEAVLLVRMHLLQAIVAFHSGHVGRAKTLLTSTAAEMESLRVPQELIQEVCAAGMFTQKEARLALRAQGNNVSAAIRYAQQVKESKEKVVQEERERKRKRLRFGKTASGNWVNLGLLQTMVKMGYEEALAARALRHTDNDVDAAIQIIQERPEVLLINDDDDEADDVVTSEMTSAVTAMGFDLTSAKLALVKSGGDIGRAIDLLTSGKDLGELPPSSSSKNKKKKTAEEIEREEREKDEACERLREDLDSQDQGLDGHLDLTLEEEAGYLERYKNMMGL